MDHVSGHISQVPLEYFYDNLLPPLRPGLDVTSVIQRLKMNTRGKKPEIKGRRWRSFPCNPSESSYSEARVFAAFAGIATAVAQAALSMSENKSDLLKQTTIFYRNTNYAPPCTNRTNASRPDGYALLKKPLVPRRGIIHWDNIAIPGETTKYSGYDNINNVCVSFHNRLALCLNDDPRSRTEQHKDHMVTKPGHARDHPTPFRDWLHNSGCFDAYVVLQPVRSSCIGTVQLHRGELTFRLMVYVVDSLFMVGPSRNCTFLPFCHVCPTFRARLRPNDHPFHLARQRREEDARHHRSLD